MAEGNIGKRYTPEEAADMIMNDDLGEMDSADSLDNEATGSDPSEISSRSDNDSDPDIDFCGRQVYPDIQRGRTRGRPRTHVARGIPRVRSGPRTGDGPRTRGGLITQGGPRTRVVRRGLGNLRRGPRTRGGGSNIGVRRDKTDESVQDDPSTQSDLLLSGDDEGSENESATDVLSEKTTQSEDLEIDNSRTDLPSEMTTQPAQSVALVDKWSKNPPTLNEFPFLEADGMDIDIPENADAMFFFKLLLSDDFIEQIVQSSDAYAESVISANRPTR